MSHTDSSNSAPVNVQDDEIDLVELFLIIWSKKFVIVGFTFFITLLTALHQLYIAKEIFRSDAVILPVNASGGGGMLSQLGGLASFVGVSAPKSENTVELILKSRSFAQEIVADYDLASRWEQTEQEAVRSFRKIFSAEASKKSPEIILSFEDESPRFAKEIVDGALILAEQKMKKHAQGKQFRQVRFLDERVSESLKELNDAEEKLRQFQEKNQGIQIESQAQALILQLSELKAKKEESELDLSISKRVLTSTDPKVKVLGMTVEELQKRIDRLVGKADEDLEVSMDERSLMDIPKIGLEYARLLRKVKINQKIYGLLLEQLEMAKIEAQKEEESFELIDPPLVPERRIKPKRTLTVAIAGVASGMLAVMGVLLLHFVANMREQRAA
jgi:uncharacterized protein involved in exopolysaccharide biosynthesis